jgi:uncharacterized protein (DUF433 family)
LSDDEGAYRQRLAEADAVVDWSLDHVLDPFLAEFQEQRREETGIIRDYLRRSFNVLIARSQGKLMEYEQTMSWQDRIVIDPEILVGKPVVKGTRLAVDFVIDLLAQGWTEKEILHNYPGLTQEDIRACLVYASAERTGQDISPSSKTIAFV